VLEALVHAVEDGRIPYKRPRMLWRDIARQGALPRRARSRPERPRCAICLVAISTGRIADDMARFPSRRSNRLRPDQNPRTLSAALRARQRTGPISIGRRPTFDGETTCGEAGRRIAIVSPASPFSREEFDRGVKELRRLGYDPSMTRTCLRARAPTSRRRALRAAAFSRAWADPSVAALIAVRGGYGQRADAPLLDAEVMRRTPKLFIGYSDNTSILSWLTCRCGITALHGPMLEGRLAKGAEGYDERSLSRSCRTTVVVYVSPDQLGVVRGGEAAGRCSAAPWPSSPPRSAHRYAFDPPAGASCSWRMSTSGPIDSIACSRQLRLSGILSRARALVFGEMRGCDEAAASPAPWMSFATFAGDIEGPIITGFLRAHHRPVPGRSRSASASGL
jgi:muramoyltetrapeptide carboxypeptidase